MTVRNSALIDPDKGVFTVLGLVALRLTGPYLWHSEDRSYALTSHENHDLLLNIL
jgi:hypothetical protein